MNPGELFVSCSKCGCGPPRPNGPGPSRDTGESCSGAKKSSGTGT
jgi:hypothetical protein